MDMETSNSYFFCLLFIVLYATICTILHLIKVINKILLKTSKKVLAFFHPYCDSGGGGERVLWMMIDAILREKTSNSNVLIAIYSGETDKTDEQILRNVEDKFRISIKPTANIIFVKIRSRTLLESKWYPVLTMLGQTAASILVGCECLVRFPPDIYCDTTGAAFIYPLVKLFTMAKVIAYVHYPTISTDMLNRVTQQRPSYNNNNRIANSTTISSLKLIYYRLFAQAYSWAGSCTDLAMVNSSWTGNHIQDLWRESNVVRVYPPCNTKHLQEIPLGNRARIILSIGQFRPEKDHYLQLQSFHLLRQNERYEDVKLIFVGGTRNAEDERLVLELQNHASQLGMKDSVEWRTNIPYDELIGLLSHASVGLHAMWNEHFGISVVEMMAAGLVVVAHRSGGPLMDIVTTFEGQTTGYLADSPISYCEALAMALDHKEDQDGDMRRRARLSVDRFSDEVFEASVNLQFENFFLH